MRFVFIAKPSCWSLRRRQQHLFSPSFHLNEIHLVIWCKYSIFHFLCFPFFFWNLGVEDILFRKEWARYLFCCYWNIHLVSVACSWLGSAYSVIIKINMYLLYKSQQVLKNIEANIVNYFKVYSNMGKSKDFYQRAVWHYKHFLAILSHI